jgi:hypothetical protein
MSFFVDQFGDTFRTDRGHSRSARRRRFARLQPEVRDHRSRAARDMRNALYILETREPSTRR